MSVYKEIHKYNFEDREPVGENTSLFYRINKKQDLAGITIPLYDNKGKPLLQNKDIIPTTTSQTVEADLDLGYLGLGTVTVEGIDAGSIIITPSKEIQTIAAPENVYYNSIMVRDIVSSLNLAAENILPGNIRHDITVFGIMGTYTGDSPIAPVADGTNNVLKMFGYGSVTNNTLNLEGENTNISA